MAQGLFRELCGVQDCFGVYWKSYKTSANCVSALHLGHVTYLWKAQVNPPEALIFQHQFQWFNGVNSHHLVLCSGQFLNHTSIKPFSPQELVPLPSEKATLQRSSAFSNQSELLPFPSSFRKDRWAALTHLRVLCPSDLQGTAQLTPGCPCWRSCGSARICASSETSWSHRACASAPGAALWIPPLHTDLWHTQSKPFVTQFSLAPCY